jgi:hypothetical protein
MLLLKEPGCYYIDSQTQFWVCLAFPGEVALGRAPATIEGQPAELIDTEAFKFRDSRSGYPT